MTITISKNDDSSIISLDDLMSSQSSEFWQLENGTIKTSKFSRQSLSVLTGGSSNYEEMNRPLEADKKSYSRMRALLIFWFISVLIILVYLIYFVYLVINKIK